MDHSTIAVNPWMMLPFGALLGLIALGPLLFAKWWLRHYAKVAFGLAAITVSYYALGLRAFAPIGHTTHEYVSFITLIGSLYVVAGGIHIQVKGGGTPLMNGLFLLIGAVIANILGTTGASMLLIRPWLRMNHHRLRAYHVVFFIFIVSNVGGCLTPIGDPPLFLGFLMGIPFWWVFEHCIAPWCVGVGLLLVIFLALDYRSLLRETPGSATSPTDAPRQWRFDGLRNLIFLAVILGAVFIDRPPFLREGLLVAAALGSWFLTPKAVHADNHFNFHPITEVAILFVGIFATMMPALDWLQANAGRLEAANASFLYWGCGSLSSMLDNAPTYLCFLKAISARFTDADLVAQIHHLIQTHGADLANVAGAHAAQIQQTWAGLQKYFPAALAAGNVHTSQIEIACLLGNPQFNGFITAISVGAVFFGASTYIGNGPNFMVKSIADDRHAPAPGFLSYIFKFTLPFMLPVLIVVWLLFFRG